LPAIRPDIKKIEANINGKEFIKEEVGGWHSREKGEGCGEKAN